MGTRTIINHCTGSFYANGKEYKNIKGTIEITDSGIFVDGKPIEEYKEPPVFKIVIEGSVETIESAREKLQQEQENCNRVFLEKSTEVSRQEAVLTGLQQELDALNGRRFRDELLNGLCRRLDEAVTQLERE